MRRVSKRLSALSVGSMGEYSRFLEEDPSEYRRAGRTSAPSYSTMSR